MELLKILTIYYLGVGKVFAPSPKIKSGGGSNLILDMFFVFNCPLWALKYPTLKHTVWEKKIEKSVR